ncbi:betaine-aldehyde dehydrogenase [Caballeronia arvi]|uniref:Betaine-aldehyde dehydrogenase n=1 Tax=Caballeronia arvi TaxID=1777135 RepID=A0A158J388_9BURK|nr:betaine-aldehyde dehydrogenase [Caballeronia arvi]
MTPYMGSARTFRAGTRHKCGQSPRVWSGQLHLNYPAWDPQAPFGGYEQSENGCEYGIEEMEVYMEVKSILGYCN